MNSNLEKFKDVLKEIFQMDQAELDFGIYRIMNQKRTEIEQFLDNELLPQVKKAFSEISGNDIEETKKELEKKTKGLIEDGLDPDKSNKILELKEKLATYGNTESMENNVFSHLTNFFKRYYDNGDFISQRRYKKDVYSIPYEGEEVKLYWANYDQYYIKTTEYFNNYSFKIDNGNKINFVVKNATTEQNNNITTGKKERRFFIVEEDPVNIEGNILNINFNYDFNDVKQKDLNIKSFEIVKKYLNDNPTQLLQFKGIFELRPTEKNNKRTLLEKHINDFTARNTFDYFIHKDLGGFLRRELDYYIKNEVLFIDDINELDEKQLQRQVSIIKVLKQIGHKIIAFLEQLENFQKKLWLKKKFVIETNYCITLDRVPKELYAQIIKNEKQIEEWIKLFAIDEIKGDLLHDGFSKPLTEKFLEENQLLVLDTKFFTEEFKLKLLKSINNLDEQTDGLLIHSENFQALNLLQKRYKEQVKCIYIDPPYNTNASPILYKNDYRESSWLSFQLDRLHIVQSILSNCNSGISIAIDDTELGLLTTLLKQYFNNHELHKVIVNHYPGSGTGRSNVSKTHEYNLFLIPKNADILRGKERPSGLRERGFRRAGTGENNYRSGRPNSFYAILVDVTNYEIMGFEEPPNSTNYPVNNAKLNWKRIYPIGEDGKERVWSLSYEGAIEAWNNGLLRCTDNFVVNRIYKDEKARDLLQSIWVSKKFNATTYGTNLLTDIFGHSGLFSYPKSLYTVKTAIDSVIYDYKNTNVLDYFAGSGTTGHAVINLNREDGGNRKYILVEMGEYFNTVTKPRIQKVIYSKDWKDGKPVSREGSSHCFKYIKLESYEDTLNNLEIKNDKLQVDEINFEPEFNESYMLNYMLDVETAGSNSLLNISKFSDPFNYCLNITTDNEIKPQKIDLIETFNYLIGIVVDSHEEMDGYRVIIGRNLEGKKILIIWRNLNEKSNEELNKFFEKIRVKIKDSEYDEIYVNGENYLENMKLEEDNWKVKLIEEEFKIRMFE